MESSHSSMEINVISAEDLRLAGLRLGKAAFSVTVRTGSRLHETASTDVHHDDAGRGCPSWNQKLNLPLPPLARSISLEVCFESASSGSRPVAAVTVPLSDFASVGPEGHLHLLSYRLRDARGERNGIINFSVRVFGVSARRQMQASPAPAPLAAMCRTGFGYNRQTVHGGVAVGYPVGYGHVVSSKYIV